MVRASPESASFAAASSLCVRVFDRVGRTHQIDGLVRGLCAVLGTISSCALQASSVEEGRFPKVSAAYDVPVCVLGLMLRHVCLEAGVPALDDTSDLFVVLMCERVRASFNAMRAQAERRGDRDVLHQFGTIDACMLFLRRFGSTGGDLGDEAVASSTLSVSDERCLASRMSGGLC